MTSFSPLLCDPTEQEVVDFNKSMAQLKKEGSLHSMLADYLRENYSEVVRVERAERSI